MFDVIVIGSGMSAVGAVLGMIDRGLSIAIVDVGNEPEPIRAVDENLYDHCERNDAFDLFVGDSLQGIHNLRADTKYLPARLTSPRFSYVTKDTDAYQPLAETEFSALQSLAKGGLANAWGAGCYRYNDRDLAGFPIRAADLEPFYDSLTREIGISGADDDLRAYFGSTRDLQPPLQISTNARQVIGAYEKRRAALNRDGVVVGRPRLAILSEAKEDRRAIRYHNLEFWQPHLPEIYNPAYTLERLVREKRVTYVRRHFVQTYRSVAGSVEVSALDLDTKLRATFVCRKLILAAGAINSARIVLQSNGPSVGGDTRTELRILDNPGFQLPLVLPWRLGAALEKESFGSIQLNVVFDQGWEGGPFQASILDLSSPARSEFFDKFPVAASVSLDFIKYFLPCMMVGFVFMPSDFGSPGSLRLRADGTLELKGSRLNLSKALLARFLKTFRRLGLYSAAPLIVRVPYGGVIHYAGSLPMRAEPRGPYECSPDGRLGGMGDVYVVDGAILPRLAAKNHSFLLMANAMRIGRELALKFSRKNDAVVSG